MAVLLIVPRRISRPRSQPGIPIPQFPEDAKFAMGSATQLPFVSRGLRTRTVPENRAAALRESSGILLRAQQKLPLAKYQLRARASARASAACPERPPLAHAAATPPPPDSSDPRATPPARRARCRRPA